MRTLYKRDHKKSARRTVVTVKPHASPETRIVKRWHHNELYIALARKLTITNPQPQQALAAALRRQLLQDLPAVRGIYQDLLQTAMGRIDFDRAALELLKEVGK